MRRVVITAAAAVAIVLGGAAIALASIPDSHGVIHGCYTVKTGTLRVIDTGKGQKCVTGQHALNWSQKGPKGPAGPAGPQGPAGVSGYTVAQCTIGEDSSANFIVVSSSGGTCSATGDGQHDGHALLVCPTGDKAISASSTTAAGNGTLFAFDPMLNTDDTGYQYVVGAQVTNPISATTDIEVTCANVS